MTMLDFFLSPERLSFIVAFVASMIMVIALIATGYKHLIIVKMLTAFLIAPLLLIPLAVLFHQNLQVADQNIKIITNELIPRIQALYELENIALKIQILTTRHLTGPSKDKALAFLTELSSWESMYVRHMGKAHEELKILKDKFLLSALTLIELREKKAPEKEIIAQRDQVNQAQTQLAKFIENEISTQMAALNQWSDKREAVENESKNLFILIASSIFLLSLITGLFFALQITRQILQMKNISKKIAKGNLSEKVPIATNDEIGQLGKNFNEMVDSLVSLQQKKDLLLRIAAHDLRNPLSVITESASLLATELNDKINPQQQQLFEMIGRASNSMIALLDNLLMLNVPHASVFQINALKVNLKSFFYEIYDFNQLIARKKQINFRLDLEINDDYASFDPAKIDQVISNLLSNAFKFSLPNSNVLMRVIENGKALRIEIWDEGPGIPEEEQSKIFTPFAKISVKPTGEEHSHGLGLALCKDIIVAHKGKIGFNSIVRKGSVFYFEIPLQKDFAPIETGKTPEEMNASLHVIKK